MQQVSRQIHSSPHSIVIRGSFFIVPLFADSSKPCSLSILLQLVLCFLLDSHLDLLTTIAYYLQILGLSPVGANSLFNVIIKGLGNLGLAVVCDCATLTTDATDACGYLSHLFCFRLLKLGSCLDLLIMARKMLIDGELGSTNEEQIHYDFDLFVIGAGSGGVRASRFSANYGAKVWSEIMCKWRLKTLSLHFPYPCGVILCRRFWV